MGVRFVRFAAMLMLFFGSACAHTLSGTTDCVQPPYAPDAVEIRYLGSGGVYIGWHDEGVLLGPSFSNPGYARALLLRVRPDLERIRTAMGGFHYERVRAIFAGHAHYDHIADIPTIAQHFIPRVPVYVNAMGMRALDGETMLKGRLRELRAGSDWIPVSRSIRVRAVSGGHAPQLCRWRRFPCVFAGTPIATPWNTPLTKHRLWKMHGGETLALVIEIDDGDGDPFLIYYNDASPDAPLGQTTGDFDLAILTIAQWQWARDYPRDLLSVLRPRHVLISHWDNFFREATQQSHAVPLLTTTRVQRFKDIVTKYTTADGAPLLPVCGETDPHWTMPAAASTMFFKPR